MLGTGFLRPPSSSVWKSVCSRHPGKLPSRGYRTGGLEHRGGPGLGCQVADWLLQQPAAGGGRARSHFRAAREPSGLGQWLGRLALPPCFVQPCPLEKRLPSSLLRRLDRESKVQTSLLESKAQISDHPPPLELAYWGYGPVFQPASLPLHTLTNIAQVPPIAWQTQTAETLLLLQACPTIVARAGDTIT